MSRRRRLPLRSFYVWHRYVGITVAVLVLVLACTGIALNHTGALKLGQRHVSVDALLDWYGVGAGVEPVSFRAGNHWVSQMGRRLFLDRTEVGETPGELVGALPVDGMVAAGITGAVWLLTPDGEIIERLTGAHGVPAGLRAVGIDSHGRLVARGAHGLYRADASLLEWSEPESVPGVRWSEGATAPAALREDLLAAYRGRGLSWERVVLDLHSGRILGAWGPWLMDAAALGLVFLASTGSWLWWQQHRKRRAHRRSHPH